MGLRMSFLKNIFVVAKNSYSEFTDDIELKANAIEVANQEKRAKAEVSQEKIKQAELEKTAKIEASQEKVRQFEFVKKNNQKNIKKIIACGDLEIVKTIIGSKEDALKLLGDDDFTLAIINSTDEKSSKDIAIDSYIKHAKFHNQHEVINYLNTLQ
jgi:hypothetical protein